MNLNVYQTAKRLEMEARIPVASKGKLPMGAQEKYCPYCTSRKLPRKIFRVLFHIPSMRPNPTMIQVLTSP